MKRVQFGLQLNRISLLLLMLGCLALPLWYRYEWHFGFMLFWFPGLLIALVGQCCCLGTPAGRGFVIAACLCNLWTLGGDLVAGLWVSAFGRPFILLLLAGWWAAAPLGFLFVLLFVARLGSFVGHPEFSGQVAPLCSAVVIALMLRISPLFAPISGLLILGVTAWGAVALWGMLGRLAAALDEPSN